MIAPASMTASQYCRAIGGRYVTAIARDAESAPARGATFIVLTRETAVPLKDCIRAIRGLDVLRRCRFVSINRAGDPDKLLGIRGPVILAHCFRLHAKVHLLNVVSRLAIEASVGRRLH